jgi:hypothetical protein
MLNLALCVLKFDLKFLSSQKLLTRATSQDHNESLIKIFDDYPGMPSSGSALD